MNSPDNFADHLVDEKIAISEYSLSASVACGKVRHSLTHARRSALADQTCGSASSAARQKTSSASSEGLSVVLAILGSTSTSLSAPPTLSRSLAQLAFRLSHSQIPPSPLPALSSLSPPRPPSRPAYLVSVSSLRLFRFCIVPIDSTVVVH